MEGIGAKYESEIQISRSNCNNNIVVVEMLKNIEIIIISLYISHSDHYESQLLLTIVMIMITTDDYSFEHQLFDTQSFAKNCICERIFVRKVICTF